MNIKKFLWNEFCEKQGILLRCVPLFEVNETGKVERKYVGRDQRPTLKRSNLCDVMLTALTSQLSNPTNHNDHCYEGILYMIGWIHLERFIPLYIGTSLLSNNKSQTKFGIKKLAGWGDGYGSHIGDLSACTLPGHPAEYKSALHRKLAKCLFTKGTQLKRPVYIWAKKWEMTDIGIWEEYGPISLSFSETLLKNVAKDISASFIVD
jgi:hypothetical protein